ncbi:UNVERIFIED_ORG: DUF2290 domain-containing protein [Roseateles sp. XES5]|nr:DUF2290 domain-containing protein [Roseateles sp. XES5]
MNKDDVRTGIAKSWELLKALSLGEIFSNPMPMKASEDFLSAVFDPAANYESIYLVGLANVDYNLLLRDYSYLQFSIREEAQVRYAYYPNPFLGASPAAIAELDELRIYVDEGALTLEEYLVKVSELRKSQHPPLLRYENAPDQYAEFSHPCSHFHLGHHDENRWAIQRVLTPLAFTMLVARQFYAEAWFSNAAISLFGKSQSPDKYLAETKLDCRILPDDRFTKDEAMLFSFG